MTYCKMELTVKNSVPFQGFGQLTVVTNTATTEGGPMDPNISPIQTG